MEHDNLKIKTFDNQIVQMINASELPVSILYYMFSNYTKELNLLFEQQIAKEQEDLQNQPAEHIDADIQIEEE